MRFLLPLLLFIPLGLSAQDLPAPSPAPVLSDYGPRNYPGYKWHWGIDYDGDMWDAIYSVEGGTIKDISSFVPFTVDGSSYWIWHIDIQGAPNRYWYYMHIFENRSPEDIQNNPSVSDDGGYELRRTRLYNPSNLTQYETHNVVILWSDRLNNRAAKILSPRGGWLVQTGISTAPYILSGSTWALTENTIVQSSPIAPTGNSGVVLSGNGDGSHLHLAASSNYPMGALKYDINPLHYVRHSTVAYSVQILSPSLNNLLYRVPGAAEADQVGERVKVNVNSAGSLDLDRVKLYLFDKSVSSLTYSDDNLASQIIYGGLPPDLPLSSPQPYQITTSTPRSRGSIYRTGIDPLTDTAGNDDFYFIGFNTRQNASDSGDAPISDRSKFPDGEYALVAMAERAGRDSEDVFYSTAAVGIDNFRPYLEDVRVLAADLPGEPVIRRHAWLLENNLLVSSEPLKSWLVPGEYCSV